VFVCICRVVTDDQIGAAVDRGAMSLDAVQSLTGAGSGCGSCHDSIEDTIASACLRRPLARHQAA
jgi:bacterioferritin-associated ferredoxin